MGLGSKFDLLEAQTQLSKDKQLLVQKSGLKKINERKLAQVLNLKPDNRDSFWNMRNRDRELNQDYEKQF